MKVTVTCNKYVFLCSLISLAALMSTWFIATGAPRSSPVKMDLGFIPRDLNQVKIPVQQEERFLVRSHERSAVEPEVGSSKHGGFLLQPSLLGATVISRSETSWSRDDDSCNGDTSFVKTTLHSAAGDTPIYVHTLTNDRWVSGEVIKGGVWEGDMVKMFYEILLADKEMQFLDIGGNIGVYGLTMGKLGRRVLFVEPLLKNVQKLCNSIRDGALQDVYVMHNALSSTRFQVGFGSYAGNVGGTYIRNPTGIQEEKAQAVLLDDILEIFNFSKIAMKMDVETHEAKVLEGGDNFFQKVDVRYLLLEFGPHRKKPDAKDIINFLARHKMVPTNPKTRRVLDPSLHDTWPNDVLWKKQI